MVLPVVLPDCSVVQSFHFFAHVSKSTMTVNFGVINAFLVNRGICKYGIADN